MSPSKSLSLAVAFLLSAPFIWSSPAPHRIASAEEVARVQRHLVRAELLAKQHDVAALTSAERAARERNLATLERYRRAGIFPHNHDYATERVPYFSDRHG